ncbi:thiamine phosphate synthase [Chitinophaga alhagiae]|uniref:Thiamine-phosphate synthase n=1 Tax=Chitinophaga alhagiae TaxID=2203219 RepID=A0ABM6WC34_9BACT|nr:thiamine phosphate synthase [Chitinophaga alhagiae]AWO01478.1 thiamine phosphate synthase [Chitinophaga alhagiae]
MERLLYISQQTPNASHLDNIRAACQAGCGWVQLRVKSGDISTQAAAAKIICDQYGAQLSVNDHPAMAAAIGAYGSHVGLQDAPLPEARRLAGPGCWLGGTANTPEQALAHAAAGADYIGYGPYRFTTTKEKLSPVLGLEGYRQLMQALRNKGITIPVLAIGGILLEDIAALMSTGIHGVAVSGLITHAADKKAMVQKIKLALSCNN